MSGIYGIFRYDGAPIDPQWMKRMRAAMAYYGPDGGGSKIEGPVGMGHLLLAVHPEDAFEQQPMLGARGIVACCARLDNRSALLETFAIAPAEAATVSDSHLLGLAFDKWGEEVCTHLEGDWALAAWNAEERQLLLARDVCGLASLYYYQGNGFVAFASSLKALLAIPEAVKKPDLLRLSEILVGWYGSHNVEATAYDGFQSVIGGQVLTIRSNGSMTRGRFWSYPVGETLSFRRDEDYVERFLELYERAVRSCLRTQKPLAAELSGGRDSGSVVSLAAPLLAGQGRELTAFTSVPWLAPDGADKHQAGNEWDLAHASATMAGDNINHVPVDARDSRVIEGIEYLLKVHDGPTHTVSSYYWVKALMEACAQAKAGTLLTGEMGNVTVSWRGSGSALLALSQQQFRTAFRLLAQGEANPWLKLKRQILKPLLTPALRAFRHLQAAGRPALWVSYSALNPEMGKRLDLDARMRAAGHDASFTPSPLADMRMPVFTPGAGAIASVVAELGAFHSFAIADPTANLTLLNYLLRVPDDQFYRGGQHHYLFQRAFRKRLPNPVVQGKPRGSQAADVGHRILRERESFEDHLRSMEAVPEIREMLCFAQLRRCMQDLTRKVNPATTDDAKLILLRGMAVGLFLKNCAESN